MYWNIAGFKNIEDLRDLVSKNDIIFVYETWIK